MKFSFGTKIQFFFSYSLHSIFRSNISTLILAIVLWYTFKRKETFNRWFKSLEVLWAEIQFVKKIKCKFSNSAEIDKSLKQIHCIAISSTPSYLLCSSEINIKIHVTKSQKSNWCKQLWISEQDRERERKKRKIDGSKRIEIRWKEQDDDKKYMHTKLKNHFNENKTVILHKIGTSELKLKHPH